MDTCGLIEDTTWELGDKIPDHSIKADDSRVKPASFVESVEVMTVKWPNLYMEINEMMESCFLINPLSRLVGTDGERSPSKIISFPLGHVSLLSMLSKTADKKTEPILRVDYPTISSTSIAAFEQGPRGLVYTISINHRRKRVTVCFQGSDQLLDDMLNRPSIMNSLDNPVLKFDSTLSETICLHCLLHEFIFDGTNATEADEQTGLGMSQYHEILYGTAVPILLEYPSYKLHFTGHGFGAAMATLYGVLAASEPGTLIPTPVSVFSFGSPYVGDLQFRSAHQYLERTGRLRHARISNHQDLVSITPQSSPLGAQWFKHVGINIKLYAGLCPLDITYPRMGSSVISDSFDELSRACDQSIVTNFPWNTKSALGHHELDVYYNRLKCNELELRSINLSEVYGSSVVVGECFHVCDDNNESSYE